MKYRGLTSAEVLENRKKYGSNKLGSYKKETIWQFFMRSLSDPIIKILLIALGIKIILFLDNFDFFETMGIAIAILLASLISTLSEYGSEKAFESLMEEASKLKCNVIRNGKIEAIFADEIVKGDLVSLDSGDAIPADGIIIEGALSVSEASINGETEPKIKEKGASLYRGTMVVSESAIMEVTACGESTVYGKIADELKIKKDDTPLKIRLRDLAKTISKVGSFLAFVVGVAYLISVLVIENNFDIALILKDVTNLPYLSGRILYALTLSLTVIIVAVPEGLPMMITLALSSNMKKMIKRNVLVRKMNGIETAGNVNMLFTDKTGTLTTGNFQVFSLIDGALNEYSSFDAVKKNPHYADLIIKSLGNNNKCTFNEKIIGGNLTDQALFKYVECQKKKLEDVKIGNFDSKNKYAYTLTKDELLIKGAFEIILAKCTHYYDKFGYRHLLTNKEMLVAAAKKMASRGLRLMACAIKKTSSFSLEDLTFVCLVCIQDEIKPNMKEVVLALKKSGVKVVMITGDNKETALAVSREINILAHESELITSEELNRLSDIELLNKLEQISVVARALPSDKSRLVKLSKQKNYVVGMTGDGVNDAPALKLADVGFAMGSGTSIAKEASDIVILDNNLKSIVTAILYGRTTLKNIRKFIMFQLTINICACFLSVICPFLGVASPITIMQMLWINMIMDTFAGLAFASESPKIDYLDEMPLDKNEKIISQYMKNQITFGTIYISIMLISFLKLPFFKEIFPTEKLLMTGFFALFIFINIYNAFNIRTHRLKITSGILKDKIFLGIILFIFIMQMIIVYYGGALFRTYPLKFSQLNTIFFLSFSIIPVDLARKWFLKVKNKNVGV